MMRIHLIWAMFALLLLALSGCDAQSDKKDESCVSNEDCTAGLVCKDGTCQEEAIACLGTEDCPDGQECINGACGIVDPGCKSDADCSDEQICNVDTGACEAKDVETPCENDGDCADGQYCDWGGIEGDPGDGQAGAPAPGVCKDKEDPPKGCATDSDCAEGEVCLIEDGSDLGDCVLVPEVGCTSDEDCPDGQYCDFGVQDGDPGADPAPQEGECKDKEKPPEGCQSDEDCAKGESCVIEPGSDVGECLPDEPLGCYTDKDCEEGEFCDFDEAKPGDPGADPDGDVAPMGECKKKEAPPKGCESDLDCDPGQKCVKKPGSDVGECQGEVDPPKGCESNLDCLPGEECIKKPGSEVGECLKKKDPPTECKSDLDCKPGEVCQMKMGDLQGICMPIKPDGCASDLDCADDEYCDFSQMNPDPGNGEEKPLPEGVCAKKDIDDSCYLDADCGPDEYCDFSTPPPPNGIIGVPGICKPNDPGPTDCISDPDCAPGEYCDFSNGADTPNGVPVFMGGVCMPLDKGCLSDADCDEGDYCDLSDPWNPPNGLFAQQGTCKEKIVETGCWTDADCKDDEYCDLSDPWNPPNGLVAEQGTCKKKMDDPECSSDADCPAGEECSDADNDMVPIPEPMPETMLCAETMGTWNECGSGCGPATCDNPNPGPDCLAVCIAQCNCPADAPYWDGALGCIPTDACGGIDPVGGICVPITCLEDKDCPEGTSCVFGKDEGAPGPGADKIPVAPPADEGICLPDGDGCVISGCSSEICADVWIDSICLWLDWYECLDQSSCGDFGVDGGCGWDMNDAVVDCIAKMCAGDPNCGP